MSIHYQLQPSMLQDSIRCQHKRTLIVDPNLVTAGSRILAAKVSNGLLKRHSDLVKASCGPKIKMEWEHQCPPVIPGFPKRLLRFHYQEAKYINQDPKLSTKLITHKNRFRTSEMLLNSRNRACKMSAKLTQWMLKISPLRLTELIKCR